MFSTAFFDRHAEWVDGKGSVTYWCLSLDRGQKRTTFYIEKLRTGISDHTLIKWHQKSRMLRWSSRMHHRLQWLKVRNGLAIQGRPGGRELKNRECRLCLLWLWFLPGFYKLVRKRSSLPLHEQETVGVWSKRVKECLQEERWESLGGWCCDMNKDDYWEHKQ